MEQNSPDLTKLEDPSLDSLLDLLDGILAHGKLPLKLKKRGVEDVLEWLRKNGPPLVAAIDEAVLHAISTLTSKPVPTNLTPANVKTFMEEAVQWVRDNVPDLGELDDATIDGTYHYN